MSVVIPESNLVQIVVDSGKLALRGLDRPLPNASFEVVLAGKTFFAYGEAARHQGFSKFRKDIQETLKAVVVEATPAKPEWCHYHKANVGHNIDNCPNVKCRTCSRYGHTDRKCQAVACAVCGKYNHATEECYKTAKCEKCGEPGHPADRCFGKKEKRPVWCCYHEVEGDHPSSQCPDLKEWECENCGEKGHFYKNCRNPSIIRSRPPHQHAPVDNREFIYSSESAQPIRRKTKKTTN